MILTIHRFDSLFWIQFPSSTSFFSNPIRSAGRKVQEKGYLGPPKFPRTPLSKK